MMKLSLVLVFTFVCTFLGAALVEVDSNLLGDVPGEVERLDTSVSVVNTESFVSQVDAFQVDISEVDPKSIISVSFKIGLWIGVGMSVVFLGFFFFIKKDGKHAKWGINLKLPSCPSCGLQQPRFRKPLNERQMLWGGYTCSKCGTEMDKYGSKIEG
ncbi:MAG: hypothetical protein ACJAZ2_002249 [Glaciecola sp.]|jgi:hypothetical protein